jgi:hypothetical protein
LANCKTTGVFQPSHCTGLLYDAIHGWMTGRMDGKLYEKRPGRPLLYVMHFETVQMTTYNLWNVKSKINSDEWLLVKLVGRPSKLRFFSQWTSLIGPSQTKSKTLNTSQYKCIYSKCKTKWNYQYLANHIGSKRTTMGKAYGTKGGAIGNMSRKMLGTHCVLDGNTMRTWWEHIENNKGLTPLRPTLPKRDPLDALCNFIGLAKFLSIPNCGHHLFWPRSMRGAWIVGT